MQRLYCISNEYCIKCICFPIKYNQTCSFVQCSMTYIKYLCLTVCLCSLKFPRERELPSYIGHRLCINLMLVKLYSTEVIMMIEEFFSSP